MCGTLAIIAYGLQNPQPVLAAASGVTDTTCTQSSFASDLAAVGTDGTITFHCAGPADIKPAHTTTVAFGSSLSITSTGAPVTLDGNHALQLFFVQGALSLDNLTLANGNYSEGGAIESSLGGLTIANSTFSGNVGYLEGGAIDSVDGPLTVTASTFSGNQSTLSGMGGAIYYSGAVPTIPNGVSPTPDIPAAPLTITNSTFSGNQALGQGGAVAVSTGEATITNSTFSGNQTPGGGGAIWARSGALVQVKASILAANVTGNCSGIITGLGYNVESGTDCGFTGATDLQSTNPLLGALASNGGPTQTMALSDSSPAINLIPAASCPVSVDQRGIARPQGAGCDAGAFEFRLPTLSVPSTITVNGAPASGSKVTYTVTSTLPDAPSVTVTARCAPASGSTFAIGTTTVSCTATDPGHPANTVSATFLVVVNGVTPNTSAPKMPIPLALLLLALGGLALLGFSAIPLATRSRVR